MSVKGVLALHAAMYLPSFGLSVGFCGPLGAFGASVGASLCFLGFCCAPLRVWVSPFVFVLRFASLACLSVCCCPLSPPRLVPFGALVQLFSGPSL